jgi:hypothetical protein
MIDTQAFLARLHATAKARDRLGLERLVAPEAALVPPNGIEPRRERALAVRWLEATLFEVEHLDLGRAHVDGDVVLVEFPGRLGELEIDGIHRVTLDARGDIRIVEGFVRPVAAALDLESRLARDPDTPAAEQARVTAASR